jgi:hypothetical protein
MIAMPRFYFDIRDDGSFTPDDEGLEFDSLDAAERAAAEAAAEIGRERLPRNDTRKVTVELRDEHLQLVGTVMVLIEVHRIDPASQILNA